MSIYQELKAAGVPLDSHESDLYAKVTPESRTILSRYKHKGNLSTFLNQVEGNLWYEIPFAFDPWYAEQTGKAIAIVARNSHDRLVKALEDTTACMEEFHAEEKSQDHFGDGSEGCSYCEAIVAARAALAEEEART